MEIPFKADLWAPFSSLIPSPPSNKLLGKMVYTVNTTFSHLNMQSFDVLVPSFLFTAGGILLWVFTSLPAWCGHFLWVIQHQVFLGSRRESKDVSARELSETSQHEHICSMRLLVPLSRKHYCQVTQMADLGKYKILHKVKKKHQWVIREWKYLFPEDGLQFIELYSSILL